MAGLVYRSVLECGAKVSTNVSGQPRRLKETEMHAIVTDIQHTAGHRLLMMSSQLQGTPLQFYWVGDSDIYAARSAEEALELHIAHFGEESRKDFSLPDVSLVDDVSLDSTNRYEDGKPAPSLREIRAHITEPGPVPLL